MYFHAGGRVRRKKGEYKSGTTNSWGTSQVVGPGQDGKLLSANPVRGRQGSQATKWTKLAEAREVRYKKEILIIQGKCAKEGINQEQKGVDQWGTGNRRERKGRWRDHKRARKSWTRGGGTNRLKKKEPN